MNPLQTGSRWNHLDANLYPQLDFPSRLHIEQQPVGRKAPQRLSGRKWSGHFLLQYFNAFELVAAHHPNNIK
jgi:hypothetical protein